MNLIIAKKKQTNKQTNERQKQKRFTPLIIAILSCSDCVQDIT